LFCPARSESWWGSATDLALEEEDSFDIDSGAADDTLREEVPWHVMVSAMKSNQKLVPSTGGSKRKYYSMVTTGNISRKFSHESKAVRMEVDNKRKREERNRQKKEAGEAAVARSKPSDIRNYFGTTKLNLTASMYPSVLALLSPSPNFTEELQDLRKELDAAVALLRRQMCVTGEVPAMQALSARDRLQLLQKEMVQTQNVAMAILLQAYLKFEEYLRDGKSDLTAGRLVAKNFYTRETRANAAQNKHTQCYWYRYRARALIVGFRYFMTTGKLMSERRGRCKGKSLIHDPVVKRWCAEIISAMPNAWSARTFRDKVSMKLFTEGLIVEGCKIGRSTATYYLHELGMELVCPKKGIYKDGHERPDTVLARKLYTERLNTYKDRECSYTGDNLQTLVPPTDLTSPEVIRVYHDECSYASHEGALSLWVPKGRDAKYKKPRGQTVMCSGTTVSLFTW